VACSGMAARSPLQAELEKLRPEEQELRERWKRDEAEGWRKLPPRAWPEYQPKKEEVPALRARLEQERCPTAGSDMSPVCVKATFDLATALVFNNLEADEGLAAYKGLSAIGHVDSVVATGVCLTEGLGVKSNEKEGLVWLQKAVDLGSAQGQYEMATLFFTGTETLDMDEPKAFKLFERSAAQGHAAGMFMTADCLLEEAGCRPDPEQRAKAVPLLYAAAEKGHRGARQYLRQMFDGIRE